MAIHRLSIDEFDEVNYELVAIHTSLEDYHLAYFINQKLPILLSKNKNDIQASSKDGEARFSRYTFEDLERDVVWNLIQNKNEVLVSKKSNSTDLFSNEVATRVYLLPEFKRVDYFLKIENPEGLEQAKQTTREIIGGLNTIDRISTVYTVDAHQIKSKNNLIF